MKRCPYCAEQINDQAVKCRYCGSTLDEGIMRHWHRSRRGKMIAGVCAGLAEEFGLPVTAVRLAAVLLTLLGAGWGILIYVVLWVIMPYGPPRGGRRDVRSD